MDYAMEYGPLGRTGMRISRIGFGGAGFGAYTPVSQDEADRCAAMAIEEYGINYFDVSPSYGGYEAETKLGHALEGRRDRVYLATKAGRYPGREPGTDRIFQGYEFEYTPARVRAELEGSLRRLRTDCVDVLQLHDITAGDVDRMLEETIPEMEKLRQEGKLRFIGVTGAMNKVLAYVAHHYPALDMVLTFGRYNLMDTSLETFRELLPQEGRGLGILNCSVLFMGAISQRMLEPDAPFRRWFTPKKLAALEEACALCERAGTTLGDLAMQFGMNCHCAEGTIVSMGRVSRLRQNMALWHKPLDLELCGQVSALIGGENSIIPEDVLRWRDHPFRKMEG